MTTSVDDLVAATGVAVSDATLTVHLSDGRSISVPLDWYPRLARATDQERSEWRIIGGGVGIHWPLVEEDISVSSILEGRRSAKSPASFDRWLAKRKTTD